MADESSRPDALKGPRGWIGVDLDGTLAHYEGWQGPDHIGEPVPLMMARVRMWLEEGREVRIFTARACLPEQVAPVEAWLEQHGIGGLQVTNTKDFRMVELWDDRCIQVATNKGHTMTSITFQALQLFIADLRRVAEKGEERGKGHYGQSNEQP